MDQTQLMSWDPEEEQKEEEEKLAVSDREPMGRLRVFAGSQRPETDFMVYRGENVIGRHESCHINIPVQSVSKKHAVIEIDRDSHLIHDCNSLNKTRRKSVILKPHVRYTINNGDLFLFADVACQYLQLPPAAKDTDSGSETGSESMFPQSGPGAGPDRREARPESDGAAGGDLIPEAADSDLESAEDSLMLSPTQPYQPKSSMPLRSDTYVKESEDDDTPWKGTESFSSRDGRHPNASIRETPSAHVVPESDDESGGSSRSNLQSMQLHYDSDTDLEDDPQPDESRTEPSNEQPVGGNNVSSETGGAAEQEADNSAPVTSVAAINHLHPAEETASEGETLDRDVGRGASREPLAPPPADLLPHFSRDSESEVEEEQDSVISSGGRTACTKMDSGLADSTDADVQGASAGSLLAPGEEGESSKADYCPDGNADAEGEAKETEGSLDKRELSDVNSDPDIDDDTSASYALQPTQCFTRTDSSTGDETAGESDYTLDAGIAAGANTEEDSTQLFACHSPTFNKEPFKGGAEEEATQPFIFQSPVFGKDPFKSGAAAASSTQEEATQPFIFQSPAFGKDPFKSGVAAASSAEEEATQPFTFQSPAFGKDPFKSGTAAASSAEEEATQPFTFHSPTFGKDPFKSSADAASSAEEEATQLFTFQPPAFDKDPFKKPFTSGFDRGSRLGKAKGGAVAVSSSEEEATQPFVAAAVTLCPVAAQQRDPSESGEEQPAESNHEDQWAIEETQQFYFQNQAAEVEHATEPEEAFIAQGPVPAVCAEDGPAPTSEERPDAPPKTRRRSLTEDCPEGESRTDSPAATDQSEAPEGGERGGSQQVNEEVNFQAPAKPQLARASEEVNGERSGDTAPVQMASDSPTRAGMEAAGPGTEERSSETPAPKPVPSRASGRRGRRKLSVVEVETSGACQEGTAVPDDQSRRRSSRSTGAGDTQDREAGGNGRRQRQKAPEASADAAGKGVAAPADRPKRGRGRPKTVFVSTTGDDHCPPEEARPQVPTVRGRGAKQRSVAAPQSQAESVESAPQTDSSSQQCPAGRGRRKQECMQPSSQETGLSSGRKRRTRAASPSDSEKEPSTPPQVKTRHRARRLSSHSSSGSLLESVAPPKNQAAEVERVTEPEEAFIAQGPVPAMRAEDGPAPTSKVRPGAPPKTRRRSLTEDSPEGESRTDSPATTDQLEAPEGGERGGSQHVNEEMNTRVPAKQQSAQASEEVNGERSGDTAPVQMAGDSPTRAGGEADGPGTEECSSETPAPKPVPSRASGRRGRRKLSVVEVETSGARQEGTAGSDDQSRRRSSRSTGAGDAQDREAGRNGQRQRQKAPEASADAAGEGVAAPADRPKRGRGRPKTVFVSTTGDDRCPPEEARPQVPTVRGRGAKQRSVATPQSQAESVESAPQTDSSSQQCPAGRGRRKQECMRPSSQDTGLSSGRKRRTRAASPSDSEKEPSTTPQVKTCRRARQLSSHSSSGSLLESVAPPKIMFTGLVDENGQEVIKQLGGEVVESVHDSTHLITDRIRRTVKFLCAVARGIPVVTPEWLIKCGKSSCFLSTSSFLVEDSDQEQKFNFKLAESLQKAKEQPLLQDYRVHVTSGVLPEPSQMESIIQCSGATVLPKMPRAYKEKTLVISCLDDLPKCKAAQQAGIPVLNAEFILTGILQQVVDLVRYRLDGDGVVDSKPEGKGRKRSSTAAATQPARGKKRR